MNNKWYAVIASINMMSFIYLLTVFIVRMSQSSNDGFKLMNHDLSLDGVKVFITFGSLLVILTAWIVHNKNMRG